MPNYKTLARQVADEVGVPAKVFLSLVRHESGFNPNARSPVGAEGLTQLMPGTASSLASKYGIDPSTPYGNLLGGAHYFKEQIDNFSGDLRKALAAYNAGPGAVEKYGDVPPYKETQAYVRNVLRDSGGMSALPSLAVPSAQASLGAPPSQEGLRNALIQNLASIGAQGGHVDSVAMLQGIMGGLALDRASTGRTLSSTVPASVSSSSVPMAGIAKTALSQRGIPYQWGGEAKLGSRTDCSGLLQAAARANGIKLPRTTYDQFKQGQPVPFDQLQPGDAVFSHPTARGPGHVSIYIGGGKVVEDPHTGSVVSVRQLSRQGIVGARRYG